MKKWLGYFVAALAAAILTLGIAPVKASAATDCSAGVALDTLANQGLLKLNGRVQVKSGYIQGEFSGIGFETNVTATQDTDLKLVYSTNYVNKISVFVDEEKTTKFVQAADGMIFVPLSKGTHMIKVVKESQISSSTTSYFRLKSIAFNGTVDSKPADKFLVEVVGDSYSCGDGSAAKYQSGTAWTGTRDDEITGSFGWYLAEMMDADFMEVGRGGQGLDGTASQETQTNKVTMPVLFDYASYGDQAAGTVYTDARIPNLVIVELGANDSHSAANKDAWVSIAKSFLLKIKARYGNVPIVWSLTSNKSHFYTGLRELLANDADMAAYDNIYVMYNYLNRNGSAALATQKGGHPDRIDEWNFASRLKDFIDYEGVLPQAEPTYTHDLVYYVSETGDNAADGLTEATAKSSVPGAVLAAKAAIGGKKQPVGTRVVIKVSGNVTFTNAQNMLPNINSTEIPYCTDGTKVPVVIETLNYDGTNRATLTSTYAPSNSGSASCYAFADLVLKNVKVYFAGSYTSGTTVNSVQNIYNQNGDITFDNVILGNVANKPININANGFSYIEALHKGLTENNEIHTNTMTFLNGEYNESTGFGYIAAIGGSGSYWSSAGNKTSALGLTCRIVIGKGAVVAGPQLKMMTSSFKACEAVVEVTTGGKVEGRITGTASGTSTATKEYPTSIRFVLSGGHVKGSFAMTGDYVKIIGDTTFEMLGGEIEVPVATTELDNTITLAGGATNVTIDGNAYKYISGGTMLVNAGTLTSAIHFSGRQYNTITGDSVNEISAGAFVIVQGAASKNGASAVYFGAYSNSAIEGTLRNIISGGIFDQTQIASNIFFGSQGVVNAIYKIENIIGVPNDEGRNEGPVFYCNQILLGSSWGQCGVKKYSATAVSDEAAITTDEVVMSTTIYGGQFSGTTYLTQVATVDLTNKRYPRTQGSAEAIVNNGEFEGSVVIKSSTPLYGHLHCELNGGFYTNIYGSNSANSIITDGFTLSVGDIIGYGKADSKTYEFKPIVSGTVKSLSGETPFIMSVNGGHAQMTLNLENNNTAVSGATDVAVYDGDYASVSGSMANGKVYGGRYQTAPAAAMLASGCTVRTLPNLLDRFFAYEVEEGVGYHSHCECDGTMNGIGGHVCDDNIVWSPIASAADLEAAVKTGAPMEAYYYLTNDFVMGNTITPLVGQKIHLCLNGHVMTAPAGKRAFMLYKSGGLNAVLSITDCDMEGKGEITGGYHTVNGPNLLIYNGSTLNLFGGKITDGTSGVFATGGGNGGNVTIGPDCTFNMYGGRISGGQTIGNGGNLSVTGKAYLYGGTISNGRSVPTEASPEAWLVGGNVYVASSATVNMYDVRIFGGKSNYGGNIYVSGTATMDGTYVADGEALVRNGGNVLLDKNSKLTIDGLTVIENGKAMGAYVADKTDKLFDGGNLYVQGSFIMNEGIIRDGVAEHAGGNIYMNSDNAAAPVVINDGEISGGKARMGGNLAVGKQDVTIKGGFIHDGEALVNPVTKGDGHGGNIFMSAGGNLKIEGGYIVNGVAGNNGGAGISNTSSTGQVHISGGVIAGGLKTDRKTPNSVITFFAATTSTFEMTGGTVIADAPDAMAINMEKTTGASITGGKIYGAITGSSKGYIEGGYFNSTPRADALKEGYLAFALDESITEMEVAFNYEVAAGYQITLGSKAESGEASVVPVTGGGAFKAGATYTLTAPAEANGYQFLRWEDAEGTEISTETVLTGVASEDLNLVAVYRQGKKLLKLHVTADAFTIKINDGKAANFTGETTAEVEAGSTVEVSFTSDKNLAAWTNESYKYVTTDETYGFTMFVDTELIAQEATPAVGTKVIYLNESDQVLNTSEQSSAISAHAIAVPAAVGKQNGRWDKTVEEINTAIANGDAVIEIHAIYEAVATTGTIHVTAATTDAALSPAWTEGATDTITKTVGTVVSIAPSEAPAGYVFVGFYNSDKELIANGDMMVRVSETEKTVYCLFAPEGTDAAKLPSITITFAELLDSTTAQVDATRFVPDTFTLVEQGLLIGTEAKGITTANALANMKLETAGLARFRSTNMDSSSVTSLRLKNLKDDATSFVRGYLIYADAEGNLAEVYTDVVSVKKDAVSYVK